jgi:ABC-type antimicrobial peptide transport system permease subunit
MQFLLESFVISFIAMILGLLTANLIVPWFNRSFNWNLAVDYSDPNMIPGLIAILLLTTILAGLYPALYLSSLNPLQILKGTDAKGNKKSGLRRILVVTQFIFAIFLIILSITFIKQIHYVKNKDIGVNIEDMIIFGLNQNLLKNFGPVKAEIANLPAVENVTLASQNPLMIWAETTDIDFDGKEPGEELPFSLIQVDFDFIKTLGLTISGGRDFDKSLVTDSANFILNETAAKIVGPDNVIGRKFSVAEKTGTVIGVIKDYHMTHMNFPMKPLIIGINKNSFSVAMVRFKPGMTGSGTEAIRKIIEKTDSDPERSFMTMREAFENIYRENIFRIGKLTVIFSILALCIACLGLISLSMYNAELRTKEIGIHKVHGADTFKIISMLTKEYLVWVSVSLVFAIPAAYLVISKLFSRTAYHTKLSFWIFLLAGIIVLSIAVCTVGWQAYRLSRQNPSRTLKYE